MDFKFFGFSLVSSIARFVPFRIGYFIAERGGDIYYLFSTRRRSIVTGNIQRVTDISGNHMKVKNLVRNVFRNAAKNYFDLTKLSRINPGNLDTKAKIEGLQNLASAVNKGKGVVIATAHLGNFEFGARVVAAQGFEMSILIEAYDDSKPFLRKIAALRRGKGVRILPVDLLGIKECLKTLQHGGIVTIVCDRDLQGNGVKTTFFGKETSFPVGAVDLALRTGATIVPIFSLRGPGNTTTIFMEQPLKLSEMENRGQALKADLDNLVCVLEKYIRKYPDQWVVLESL